MKIRPIQLGLPAKQGTDLLIRVISFDSNATSAALYYEVRSEAGERLAEGNINLDETEFSRFSKLQQFVENLTLERLGLVKEEEECNNPAV